MTFDFRFDSSRASAILDTWFRENDARLERAFLTGTARGARRLVENLRGEMAGAGLGRLGQAVGDRSDKQRGGIQRRYGNGGFSASAQVYVRSGSARSRGALVSYLRGADIRPVRGRWLWIPTDDIRRIAGVGSDKRRVEPGNWKQFGLDQKIGPLTLIKGPNGNPLLIVKNVGVSAAGKARSAKALTKRGLPRKGQVAREIVVAFVAIPRTARAARVDIDALYAATMNALPGLIAEAYGKV
jgi:hypothetical protein